MMPRYELSCALWLPESLDEVFAVFEDPRNLAAITPAWLRFRILTEDPMEMRKGLHIDYLIRWMGIPLRWRTRIADYHPPCQFIDEQIRGPYRLWRHTHTFEEQDQGVIVRDRVEYELPMGILGTLAHGLVVRHQLLAIFCYRQQAIARRFGGPVHELRPPSIQRVR